MTRYLPPLASVTCAYRCNSFSTLSLMSHHSPTPDISVDEQRRAALDHHPFKDDWWFIFRAPDALLPTANIISLFDSEYLERLLLYTPGVVARYLTAFEPFLVRLSFLSKLSLFINACRRPKDSSALPSSPGAPRTSPNTSLPGSLAPSGVRGRGCGKGCPPSRAPWIGRTRSPTIW